MFTTRKRPLTFALVVVGAVVLAGCSGQTDDGGGGGSGDVRVLSWRLSDTTTPLGALHESWIEGFNAADTGYTAKGESVPFADKGTKLVNDVLAGNPADVVALTTAELPDYADNLMPITDMWEEEGYDDTFLPVAKDLATWDGEIYGVPIENGSSDGLYYNTEVLAAAGVTIEDATKDWDSFRNALSKITATGANGLVLRGKDPSTFDYNWTWFTGAGASFNDPATFVDNVCGDAGHDAFNFLVDLYTQDKAVKVNPAEVAYDESYRIFSAGDVGFNIDGPWGNGIYLNTNPDLEGKLAVTLPPPMEAGGDVGVNLDALIYVIPKGAKNPEGAMEYIKWATSAEHQVESAKQGFLPTIASVNEDPVVTKNPILAEYASMMADHGFPRPRGPEMEKNKTALVTAFQSALSGSQSADDALDTACGSLQNNS